MSVPHTLGGPANFLQDIRKSRFFAQAAAADDPQKALAFVADKADLFATHNCWAYRIGQRYRFSDDGEPGGTAGRPILQAIEAQGLDQVVLVVTRWYGGIKLGAGGLARAYGGCAAECLRLAARIPLLDLAEIRIGCEFAWLPVIHARLAEYAAECSREEFDASGVELCLRLPRDKIPAISGFLRDLSRGRAKVRIVDEA